MVSSNKGIVLSPRLASIACLVARGSVLADIGCDHGYLARHLLERDICSRVIASDISPKSIAKLSIEDARLSKRVGQGLDVLETNDNVDTIVIAGMGGRTICDILSGNTFGATLILSPQSMTRLCRLRLVQIGYTITDDYMIFDKKYYTIIRAVRATSDIEELTDRQLEYGRFCDTDVVLRQYIASQIATLSSKDSKQCRHKIDRLRTLLDTQ